MSKMPAVTRCEECRKKLGLLGLKCKCGKDLCITHLSFEAHSCKYDYKSEAREKLRQEMDIGPLSSKLEKI